MHAVKHAPHWMYNLTESKFSSLAYDESMATTNWNKSRLILLRQ